MLQAVLLLALSLAPWPDSLAHLKTALDSARSSELKRAHREGTALSYYEGLLSAAGAARGVGLDDSSRPIASASGLIRFQEADVVCYLNDDFLQFELMPLVERTLFGQLFATNDFGMHDDPVTLAKPEQTLRVAFLGSSMDMGWGVKYKDTYINQFEAWLGDEASRRGASPPRRFEALNFAVAAYSPLQRLDTLRRKVLAFQPDLVICSATTLDTRLMEIHLCEMLRKHVDLKYDFLREIVAQAGLRSDEVPPSSAASVNKEWIKRKLRPLYWSLYDATIGAMAAECRSLEIPLVMVIIPRVGKADAPTARAEPVALLKALAAHHGVTALDLSATFDHCDPSEIEIAAWDDHPNAAGHRRLCGALAAAVLNDRRLSHILFDRNPGSGSERSEPLSSGLKRTKLEPQRARIDSPAAKVQETRARTGTPS
jgi:hypothetical protein